MNRADVIRIFDLDEQDVALLAEIEAAQGSLDEIARQNRDAFRRRLIAHADRVAEEISDALLADTGLRLTFDVRPVLDRP